MKPQNCKNLEELDLRPEFLQVLKVLEISLLDSADRIPVQVQELQVWEHAQGIARNRPATRTTFSHGSSGRRLKSQDPVPIDSYLTIAHLLVPDSGHWRR